MKDIIFTKENQDLISASVDALARRVDPQCDSIPPIGNQAIPLLLFVEASGSRIGTTISWIQPYKMLAISKFLIAAGD
jgi:hypothetical protein